MFPLPKTGCEVIQNGKLSVFNGLKGYDRYEATLVPTKGGSFVPIRRRQSSYFRPPVPSITTFDVARRDLDQLVLAQRWRRPKQAGEMTLVYALTDGHLKAWTYNPGQRRVRRNPNFEYDNPVPGWQGLVTIDAVNGYVGAADRYDWKLIGKQEIYIPYNNHKFFDTDLKYEDIIQPRYPRRDLIRYELHRVWVVEGTVRPDKRHVIARRVFYLDEDSWLIVVVDGYDTRGNLWRVSEHTAAGPLRDPLVRRQRLDLLRPRGGPLRHHAGLQRGEGGRLPGGSQRQHHRRGFTPDDLRRMGRR